MTGTPNSAPPDIQNQTSTGTSATLLDSTLDGSTPGSGAVTFSAAEEANWTLNLQHQVVAMQYQGYPTQGGGSSGPQLNFTPNMGLSDHRPCRLGHGPGTQRALHPPRVQRLGL